MEVLLLVDIPGVGKRNDIVVVKDGYALNHLLPTRKALVATPTVRQRYAEEIKRRASEREAEERMRRDLLGSLDGKIVVFEKRVTQTGKLYGAVALKEISEELKKQHQIVIPEEALIVSEPIKSVGTFPVSIRIGTARAQINVEVKGREGK
jgi:large subunit ribosomal protein L9